MIDDETLVAYADGELAPSRAAAVEQALASDPALAARLEQHRRLVLRLRAAYDPVLTEPVPDRLARTMSGSARVISLADARTARTANAAPLRDWRAGGLIAAGLAIVLVVGQALWAPGAGPVVERGGQLVASGDLGRALDTQLSGGGAIRIQLTFRDQAGAICRSFTGATASGVACRRNGRWALEALFAGEAPSGGDYRMAASGNPRVLQVVGDMISGDAFDAAQERAAKARHWTP